jgi:hypothetical protein
MAVMNLHPVAALLNVPKIISNATMVDAFSTGTWHFVLQKVLSALFKQKLY